ncbi:uncharacterized protein Dana_GF27204, partial [Drosophila ananassae]
PCHPCHPSCLLPFHFAFIWQQLVLIKVFPLLPDGRQCYYQYHHQSIHTHPSPRRTTTTISPPGAVQGAQRVAPQRGMWVGVSGVPGVTHNHSFPNVRGGAWLANFPSHSVQKVGELYFSRRY